MKADLYGLAVIGVLLSAVGAFYYLRIVKIMYFDEPAKAFDPQGAATRIVLALSTALVIFYALAPGADHQRRHGRRQVAVLNAVPIANVDLCDTLARRLAGRALCDARLHQRRRARSARSRAIRDGSGSWPTNRRRAAAGTGATGARRRGNLYASALLVDPCEPAIAPQIGFVAGVAAAARRRRSRRRRAALKWPNDLVVDGAKLAGLLVEGVTPPRRALAAIVGIGVNVVSSPEGSPIPRSRLSGRLGAPRSAQTLLFARLVRAFR